MNEVSRKILLVDGSHSFIHQVTQLLELQDYKVLSAQSAEEGLQICVEQLPDLIICGATLRDTGGHHFLMALRDDQRVAHIPLIFIGLRENREDMRMAMNLGADDYMVQPFKRQDLLSGVRARLTRFAIFRGERQVFEPEQDDGMPPSLQEKYHLSKTEIRILKLIAEGKNTKEIAAELYVSSKTIENHRYNIARKLGLSGRNALTEYVIKNIIQRYRNS
ncbi:response regulator transcription factor [uncultured Chitinophaga sp.]|jgi:Response regulator containing a CheY-like receiver domain and an HTH DNA-binding domain|uniref:response regulator transcription factor n=1 Tax=uncultured Chitinophaga sp. TaxID=339340 RepID=UPI00261AE0A8|nr:response regulator transcription factor [uncultured Chitinophaga sp.]